MTLVSPGVETSIVDQSLTISNAATSIPLFFIATQDEKIRGNGQRAEGTYEHSRVRAVTSVRQAVELYGEPNFLADAVGNQFHGDARNEYGLQALISHLGVGNAAFVVRANVNLNDNFDDIENQWEVKTKEAGTILNNLVNNYINNFNASNGLLQAGLTMLADTGNAAPVGTFNQTQANFNGTSPNGSFIGGTGYNVGDIITFVNSMAASTGDTVRVDQTDPTTGAVTHFTLTNQATLNPNITVNQDVVTDTDGVITLGTGFQLVFDIANVSDFRQTSFDFNGLNGNGSFAGGSGYLAGDIISLSNGAAVRVLEVDGTGQIVRFVITDVGTFIDIGTPLSSTNGTGSGFIVVPEMSNGVMLRNAVSYQELLTLARDAARFIFDPIVGAFSFRNLEDDFFEDKTTNPLFVFGSGFDMPATSDFIGFDGLAINPDPATTTAGYFTPEEAENLFNAAANDFMATQIFLTRTSLGANDASRRVSIVNALQQAIVNNQDIRSESFQYNLVACPGYPEVVDELLALTRDSFSEAMVIADTPPNLSPDGITNPTNGWAASTGRQNSTEVAYYYPWGLTSNLDGVNILAAPSGIAIRQITFSDSISQLFFAPAGINRGLITGLTDVGYVSDGVLGSATTFTPIALNQGQRDNLYQDTPSGRINPIAFIPGRGITLMGQKTSAPAPSALDRINVSRLVMHVRRQLRLGTFGFLFEPNDEVTRANVKAVADNFLGTILTNRGIDEFVTISDESNNTPDVIGRNELILDVLIRPTKAVEFISIPIRIVTQGAEI